MKQIEKTQSIVTKLERQGLAASDVVVFEAIALNTRPLRKQSVLYKGAIAQRGLLLEMAASLEAETVPLQIMHDGHVLPIGRVFEASVLDTGVDSELRVLFAVHASETDQIAKIEAGIVDQVSVSILPKQILNSVSGFDYIGPDASMEQIFTGDDGKGNVLGENGVYAKLVGLDSWNELSLVNKGGAQNARIVSRDNSIFSGEQVQRLAASGLDPNKLLLTATATPENTDVDLTTLVTQLTDTKVELSTANTSVATLTATVAERDARIAELEAQVAEAGDSVAKLAEKDATIADLTPALDALKDVAKTVLVAKGDVDPTLPEDVADLVTLISESKTEMSRVLVAGARAIAADSEGPKTPVLASSAFQSSRPAR